MESSELLERARGVNFCSRRGIILRGSVSVGTENQWRSALDFATATELEILTGHVRAAEIQQAHDRAWQDDVDAARAERDRPYDPNEPEAQATQQLLDDARAAAVRAASPMSQAQAAQLIALNERIAASLEKK
jgi:hypothetical protein